MMNSLADIKRSPGRISEFMLDLLMDCHERELLKLKPHEAGTTRYCKGLIIRGFLTLKECKTEKGKIINGLYVTDLGKRYLEKI